MKTYKQFLKEANASAMSKGQLDWSKITLEEGLQYCKDIGIDVSEDIPNYVKNFPLLQKKVKNGWTERRDMPRITRADQELFAQKLIDGELDINAPYSKTTDPKNPFPEKLERDEAKEFLIAGLKDGNKNDDKIKVKIEDISVEKLKPTQKEIYFDQTVDFLINYKSVKTAMEKTNDKTIIASNDYSIIDGHHNFAFRFLIDPKSKMKVMKIDLPTEELLKLALAVGDAVGNKRNK